MRFLALACTFLASSTAVLSIPGSKKTSACCCCDISSNQIVCETREKNKGCFCAAVVCPTSAPTVWVDPIRTLTSTADAEKPEEQCCCCDPNLSAIVCEPRDKPNDCFCLAVACPINAPTITITAEPSQTIVAV